jgi:hypothetical protein
VGQPCALRAGNHPGSVGAAPPESGGEFLKPPSSDEEGWRLGRRGGAGLAMQKLEGTASRTPTTRQKSANNRRENGRQRASLLCGARKQRDIAQHG